MADFHANVRGLSDAAWRLRARAPAPSTLPFALTLFTDDRRTPNVMAMLSALPDAGRIPPIAVLFRHDRHPHRMALAEEARAVVQARGHYFVIARAFLPRADGIHQGRDRRLGLRSAAVHSLAEVQAANALGVDLGFVSPVFATRSHPGATPLGPLAAATLAQLANFPCLALGGMDARTARQLEGLPFQGIGAIGAFTDQG
ncbi:thiamine phosphate synthase [Parvularcula sp. LCG005]|uniref:thiamine phosphate synthase n=1 Tax=Parvularcula sp. LCG005 TaxID=3078805 RepID=UPI0029432DDF|nr:thiamine phosphate synthase [Parvularcula sp. LCG005]WOI53220.1 thiamine phosphate synthase [Parvularcula sp. LCG005]